MTDTTFPDDWDVLRDVDSDDPCIFSQNARRDQAIHIYVREGHVEEDAATIAHRLRTWRGLYEALGATITATNAYRAGLSSAHVLDQALTQAREVLNVAAKEDARDA